MGDEYGFYNWGHDSAGLYNTTSSYLHGAEDRTLSGFDLQQYGIDTSVTFDRLLSPAGLVNQFTVTAYQVLLRTVGFFGLGVIWSQLNSSVTASQPLYPLVRYFEKHLNPQSVFTTLMRGFLMVIWELIMRVVTSFLIFGIGDTVSQVLAVSLDSVVAFVTDPIFGEIQIWRFILSTIFVGSGFMLFPLLGLSSSGTSRMLDLGLQTIFDLIQQF